MLQLAPQHACWNSCTPKPYQINCMQVPPPKGPAPASTNIPLCRQHTHGTGVVPQVRQPTCRVQLRGHSYSHTAHHTIACQIMQAQHNSLPASLPPPKHACMPGGRCAAADTSHTQHSGVDLDHLQAHHPPLHCTAPPPHPFPTEATLSIEAVTVCN